MAPLLTFFFFVLMVSWFLCLLLFFFCSHGSFGSMAPLVLMVLMVLLTPPVLMVPLVRQIQTAHIYFSFFIRLPGFIVPFFLRFSRFLLLSWFLLVHSCGSLLLMLLIVMILHCLHIRVSLAPLECHFCCYFENKIIIRFYLNTLLIRFVSNPPLSWHSSLHSVFI